MFDEPRAPKVDELARTHHHVKRAPVSIEDPPRRAQREPIPGMSEHELRALHQRYATARQGVGSSPVRYESLEATLQKQVPDLLEKHRCASLSFDVAVRDGKVILKATPKR
jgi:hypothetical protein